MFFCTLANAAAADAGLLSIPKVLFILVPLFARLGPMLITIGNMLGEIQVRGAAGWGAGDGHCNRPARARSHGVAYP
jgi:hypothetical protein